MNLDLLNEGKAGQKPWLNPVVDNLNAKSIFTQNTIFVNGGTSSSSVTYSKLSMPGQTSILGTVARTSLTATSDKPLIGNLLFSNGALNTGAALYFYFSLYLNTAANSVFEITANGITIVSATVGALATTRATLIAQLVVRTPGQLDSSLSINIDGASPVIKFARTGYVDPVNFDVEVTPGLITDNINATSGYVNVNMQL